MKNRSIARQSGFTLLEIAIVLVIIGILIVSVLQGQEMIENSKTKSIVGAFNGVAAAYNSYVDHYQVPPGDETVATLNNRGWTTITASGNGNGVLQLTTAATFVNTTAETEGFWSTLRASGLLAGDPAAVGVAGLLTHRANGLIGVTNNNGTGTVYGQTGVFVCASGLTTKQAAAIDIAVDGPLPATQIGNNVGRVLAATSATNPLAPAAAVVATAYNEATTTTPWTVCMKM